MFVAPQTGAAQGARRRVLAITSEPPWPLDSGGHIRTFHLMRALARRFDLRLVVPVERTGDPAVAVLGDHGVPVREALTGRRHPLAEAVRVGRALVAGEPYVMFHRHNRPAVRDAVRDELAAAPPDVVYLDHVDPYAYRPLFPAARLVIDFHNLYAQLAVRVADEAGGLKGRYLRREAVRLEAVERRAVADAAAVLAVSADEQRAFQALDGGRVTLVPNGVDCARYRHLPAGRTPDPPVLLFIGALSWPPNAAAAEFLATRVLPQVRAVRPGARLWIVGRRPGPAVRSLAAGAGVDVHADVPDVLPFLEGASLMAVPLDAGGGTRLKILEAFAAGVPVVTTRVGGEGIDAVDGEHVRFAERDGFARAILDVLADPAAAAARAARARAVVEARYDWTAIGERACDAVEQAAT